MAPKVYGKKTRAIYDPLAVFEQKSSPEGRAPVANQLEKGSRHDRPLDGRYKNDCTGSTLAEVSSNAAGRGDVGKRKPGRPRRKIVVEDSDDSVHGDSGSQNQQPEQLDSERDEVQSTPRRSGHLEDTSSRRTKPGSILDDHTSNSPILRRSPRKHATSSSANSTSPRKAPEPTSSLVETPSQLVPPNLAQLLALSSHELTDFTTWADQLNVHFTTAKIAEASFGEVYRLSLKESTYGICRSQESVLKIIALRPDEPFDSRSRDAMARKTAHMSSPDDVASEVHLLQRMSCIPGFINFRDVRVVQGAPPRLFQKAYKEFNVAQKAKGKDQSHFPDPGKKTSYSAQQLWAVIEMQDAGTDLEQLLECGDRRPIAFVWDVFWQVVLSLAKGEEGAEFEHRDLHLGNICVRQPADLPTATKKKKPNTETRKLGQTGVETTIIDYTISRAAISAAHVAYTDLEADLSLFHGDSTDEYQYDIYRYMRGATLADDPYAEFPTDSAPDDTRSWKQYRPVTNLIWLHYILYKLLEHLDWPSGKRAPPRKQRDAHAQWKRVIDLEHALLRVQDLLVPGVLCTDTHELRSAGDLVGLALEEGWLDVEDVVDGIGVGEEPQCDVELAFALESLDLRDDGDEVRAA